jgi:hypothetical protein
VSAESDKKTPDAASSEARSGGKAQRKARRDAVNAELRQGYDEVVKEPVPDRFKAALGDPPGDPPVAPDKTK